MHDDGTPSRFSPDPEQAAALAQLLGKARRWVPAEFDIDAFWFDLLGDLDVTTIGKLNLIQHMVDGEVPFDEIREMRQELDEGVERWNDLLGAETAEVVRGVVRRFNLNPRDLTQLTALPPGDPDEDAAVQLFAFLRTTPEEEVTHEERLDLLRRAAEVRPRLPGVQQSLAKMYTAFATWFPEPERRRPLLLEAMKWLDRALRQRPDDAVLNEDAAYTVEELQEVSSRAEAEALVPRLVEHYTAVLRRADEPGGSPGRTVSALHGLGLAQWRLALRAGDPAERRRLLAEALAHLQRAIGLADGDERTELCSTTSALALDFAWLPGDPAERRRMFETALELSEAAVSEDEATARHRQGAALVGLALVGEAGERPQLVARAAGLFAAAAGSEPEDRTFDRDEARAWLHLAGATAGAERREAAGRAVAASRRALAREPGKGEYDLACALSLAGDLDEAARTLAALVERDSGVVHAALADADFAPLWEARPDLRVELERLGR